MSNYLIPDKPVYSNIMRMLETADPAHADLFNNLFGQLLENDEYLSSKEEEHCTNKNNPHSVTARHLSLENVNNTSDMDKPVSLMQQAKFDSLARVATTGSYNDLLDKPGLSGGVIVSEEVPPGNPILLWVDTANGGISKYWDGTAWVACKAVWG